MHSSTPSTSTNIVDATSSTSQQISNIHISSNSSSNCHSSPTLDNCKPSTSKNGEENLTSNDSTNESLLSKTPLNEEKRMVRNQGLVFINNFVVLKKPLIQKCSKV